MKKLVSILLMTAVVVAVLSIASVGASAKTLSYSQDDSRWAEIMYGDWNISDSGSGILATVNAVEELTGNFIPPTKLAQWGYDNGYYNKDMNVGVSRWEFYTALTESFGALYDFGISNCQSGDIYSLALKNHLLAGGTAIVHMDGHFMAVHAYEPSVEKFLFFDSAPSEKRGIADDGSWRTADSIHENQHTRIDWFCLVSKGSASTKPTDLYSIKASVIGEGGKVHFGENASLISVPEGTSLRFKVTPSLGYRVSNVLICGEPADIQNEGAEAEYSFLSHAEDCHVAVTFEKTVTAEKLYTVDASVSLGDGYIHFGNGVIASQIPAGTKVNFEVIPISGQRVSEIFIGEDMENVLNDGGRATYSFVMPEDVCHVFVAFDNIPLEKIYRHTEAIVAGGLGDVHFGNGITEAEFEQGSEVAFKATPGEGYKVSSVTVNGESLAVKNNGAAAEYAFTVSTHNVEVAVVFTKRVCDHVWTQWTFDNLKHTRKCTQEDCDAVESEAHKGGGADCVDRAKCSVCNAEYGTLGMHYFDGKCSTDSSHHWRVCLTAGCEEIRGKEKHSYNKDGYCTTCNAKDPEFFGIEEDDPSEEDPNESNDETKEKPKEEEESGCSSTLFGWLSVASVTLIGMAVTKKKAHK